MSETAKNSERPVVDFAAAQARPRQAWSRPSTRIVAADEAKATDAGASPDGTPFTS